MTEEEANSILPFLTLTSKMSKKYHFLQSAPCEGQLIINVILIKRDSMSVFWPV